MIDLFFIFIFAFAADQPDEMVWVGGDKGIRQVPIYYVEKLEGDIKGVYRASEDSIYIMKGWGDKWALPACTIRQHEILHAWGYDHVSMSQFNCPNPNSGDPMWGTYQEGLAKNWNPHYEWNGYHNTVHKDMRLMK